MCVYKSRVVYNKARLQFTCHCKRSAPRDTGSGFGRRQASMIRMGTVAGSVGDDGVGDAEDAADADVVDDPDHADDAVGADDPNHAGRADGQSGLAARCYC